MILTIPLILAFLLLWKMEDESATYWLGLAVTLVMLDIMSITLNLV
jgi:hypothetical protein